MTLITMAYIARAATALILIACVCGCAKKLDETRDEGRPQDVTQLRARHVLPIIGIAVPGLMLAVLMLNLFPH